MKHALVQGDKQIQITAVPIFLIIFGAYMNVLFILKKIFFLIY